MHQGSQETGCDLVWKNGQHPTLWTPVGRPVSVIQSMPDGCCLRPAWQIDKLVLEAEYVGDPSMAPREYMTLTSTAQVGWFT